MTASIPNEHVLEERLSEPTPGVREALRGLPGDFLLLGAGGKMGLSLARMIARASHADGMSRRIHGVSRFSDPTTETALREAGVHTIACDLLDETQTNQLPEAPNVVFMTGMKFGGIDQAARMWAMNTLVPARWAARYRQSRWMAFSTGNVYAYTTPKSGGSCETDPLQPVGEYGMSCLGRERVLEHASRHYSIPMSIVRLNYACDLRYGVLVDLARKVWAEEPIDVSMGHFNTIWQGDANAMALQSLALAAIPPWLVNVTGPETLSIRQASEYLARRMGKTVTFQGIEAGTALLSNASEAIRQFGRPRVTAEILMDWVADWVARGGRLLNKPTHFQERSGRF